MQFLISALTYVYVSGSTKCNGSWQSTRIPLAGGGRYSISRTQLPPDSRLLCPAESIVYDCYRLNATRAEELQNRVFHSTNCRTVGSFDFLQRYENTTIRFFGDSVLQQVYQNIVCQLFLATSTGTFKLSWGSKYEGCNFSRGCGQHLISSEVFFPSTGTTLTFLFLHWGLYQHQLKTIPAGPMNVFVLCFGYHYNEFENKPARDYDSNDYRSHITDVKLDAEKYHLNSPVFLIEPSPQHFAGTNKNGYWNGKDDRCGPYVDVATVRSQDWRVNILNETKFTPNVKIVKVAETLYSQWDAHFNDLDCTHWCKFGGALEFIQNMLFLEMTSWR